MKHFKFLIIALLLSVTPRLSAQVAYGDTWRYQGENCFQAGKALLISGAAMAAFGGGMIWLASEKSIDSPDDLLAVMSYGLGMMGVIGGVGVGFAGIPVMVAGHSIMQCEEPWRNVRYDRTGLGIILEGGGLMVDYALQMRASIGYHFGSHIFLGAGTAPSFWFEGQNISPFTLPVYADFRWSMCNRLISPYLGVSAGMEVINPSPYQDLELGARIRSSQTSNQSLWTAVYVENAHYSIVNLGVKMGYSF